MAMRARGPNEDAPSLVKLTAGNAAIVCQWPPSDRPTPSGGWVVTCSNGRPYPLDYVWNLHSRRSRDLVVENRGAHVTSSRAIVMMKNRQARHVQRSAHLRRRKQFVRVIIRGLVWGGTTTKQPIWVRRNDITAFSNDGKERRGKTGV